MMSDVNWWLMALAFVVGLVLTFALMIRRVKREVPVYGALGRGPHADATAKLPQVDADATGKLSTGGVAAGGAAAGGAAAAKLAGGRSDAEAETSKISAVGGEPYGSGSARVAAAAAAPSGYTIKGNEDSMLYHTPDSPSYEQTIGEIWFRDVDSAERAGFSRWDLAGGTAVTGAVAAGGASAAAAKFADTSTEKVPAATEEPYGPGSARIAAGAAAPSGYTVKGNEDSMLYHTPASPSYKQTIAEIWFRDEETAVAAGFARWDSGKSQRGQK